MEFSIHVDLSGVLAGVEAVMTKEVLPELRRAVWKVAQQVHVEWVEAVHRSKLWTGEKENYANSIDLKETGAYSALVWSDYKYAEDIETGRPPYDLKKMLQTSTKVRTSKTGAKYLIIPFQHNIKAMPPAVYQAAKALSPSRVTGSRLDPMPSPNLGPGGTIVHPKRLTYAWGGRLKADAVPQMLRKHAGMVRFDIGTPKSPRSSYLTFRVMSERSSGWIIPAQPGQHIVKTVVDRLRPQAEKEFADALLKVA